MATEERRRVSTLIAAARRDLEEAKASLAHGDDCRVAVAMLARAAKRRDEATLALLDARRVGEAKSGVYTHMGYVRLKEKQEEIPMIETVTYNVPGMHCGHCERAVSEQLSAIAGVKSVEVDLKSKSVVVVGSDLNDERLRMAIDEAGYEAA